MIKLNLFRRGLLFAVLAAFALTGCAKPPVEVVSKPPVEVKKRKSLDDLKDLPQDCTAYLDPKTKDKPLISPEESKQRAQYFHDAFFSPWRLERARYPKAKINRTFAGFIKRPGYDGSGGQNSAGLIKAMAANANMRGYPNLNKRGVTVANTNLRALPTLSPIYSNPSLPGQGYPFDHLQLTALWANTPVFITHISRDGSWVLAETQLASGWLPASDVAIVDPLTAQSFEQARFVSPLRDEIPLGPLKAQIGTLFPLAEEAPNSYVVYLAGREPGGGARLDRYNLSKSEATIVPLTATPANIAKVCNAMMGQVYRWGGLEEKRDCSSTTRDVFVPFGLWLPRNSKAQANYVPSINLDGLPLEDKEKIIRDNAVAFGTLVWLKGHIMLYVGDFEGWPVVFHNMWGLRTINDSGREGRMVVGKAVVSSLRFGENVPLVGQQRMLLPRVKAISFVAAPAGRAYSGVSPSGQAQEEYYEPYQDE